MLGKNISNKTSSNKAAHFLGTHKQLNEQIQSALFIFTSCPTVLNQRDSGGRLLQHTLEETSSTQSQFTPAGQHPPTAQHQETCHTDLVPEGAL